MSLPKCSKCGREISIGERAWRSDWKVLNTTGTTAAFTNEARYTCDDCEGES